MTPSMSSTRLLATASAVLCLAAALARAAQAHHAFQAVYDCKRPVLMTGTVSLVEWFNPHVFMHIRMTAPNGPDQNWVFESSSPGTLERLGIVRDTLKVGDVVTVRGHQSKDKLCPEYPATHVPTCHAVGGAIVLANGKASSLAEDAVILNNSMFNSRPLATPEQLLSALGESCGVRPKQGRGD